MNTKDAITFTITALFFTFVFQYFIGNFTGQSNNKDQIVSGQKMTAPKAVVKIPELHAPLRTEIDFLDTEVAKDSDIALIETPLMDVSFSSNGAQINSIVFKDFNASDQELQTFSVESPEINREKGAFLLAFNEKTPYYYDFVSKEEDSDSQIITYKVRTSELSVIKKFKVYNDKYQIDLMLTIDGAQGNQARLFIPGPFLSEISSGDVVQGVMNIPHNKVQKEVWTEALAGSYWPAPTLFGAEDRYFVHALVNDFDGFTLRGFYMLEGEQGLTSIIESYPLDGQLNTSNMSFYVGPKEVAALNVVDPRLEMTLDYGFFAPVSKFLLSIIKFMHDYVPNYGWLIILLTLLIKLFLVPFGFKQSKAMKSRKELQRKLAYIEQKYKHDPETLMREKGELIKKHGMPDMLGCLPIFIQLPLFWGLNRVLTSSIDLFQASFLWIPDLSAPDPLYILPLLMAVGMMLSLATVGDVRQRLPLILMSIIIGAVMANLASGLTLFIATSTWLTVVENQIKKSLKL